MTDGILAIVAFAVLSIRVAKSCEYSWGFFLPVNVIKILSQMIIQLILR